MLVAFCLGPLDCMGRGFCSHASHTMVAVGANRLVCSIERPGLTTFWTAGCFCIRAFLTVPPVGVPK